MSQDGKQSTEEVVTPLQLYLQAFLFSMYKPRALPELCFDAYAGKPIYFEDVNPSFILLWNFILTDHINYLNHVVEQDEKMVMFAERLSDICFAIGDNTILYRTTTAGKGEALRLYREVRGTKLKLLQILKSCVKHAGLCDEWHLYLKLVMEKIAARGVSHSFLLEELAEFAHAEQGEIAMQITCMKDTWVWHTVPPHPNSTCYIGYDGGYSAVDPIENFTTYHTEKNSPFLDEYGEATRVVSVEKFTAVEPSLIYMMGQLCELSKCCDRIGFYFNNIAGCRIERVNRTVIDNDIIFVDLWNALLNDYRTFEPYVTSLRQKIIEIRNGILASNDSEFNLQIVIEEICCANLNKDLEDYLINDAHLMFRDHSVSGEESIQRLKSRISFSLNTLMELLYWSSRASSRGEKLKPQENSNNADVEGSILSASPAHS